MGYATLSDIKQSFDKILTDKGIRYEMSENKNTLNLRLHFEDIDGHIIYENISVILACNNTLTICMFCNNISKLDMLYAFNPQIGYSLFDCANSFALVKMIRPTNKIQLEVTLLPFHCEDSDKIIEMSLKQLLFALDKVKKLENEMIAKYEKTTEDKKQQLVLEALSKEPVKQSGSGFVYIQSNEATDDYIIKLLNEYDDMLNRMYDASKLDFNSYKLTIEDIKSRDDILSEYSVKQCISNVRQNAIKKFQRYMMKNGMTHEETLRIVWNNNIF